MFKEGLESESVTFRWGVGVRVRVRVAFLDWSGSQSHCTVYDGVIARARARVGYNILGRLKCYFLDKLYVV